MKTTQIRNYRKRPSLSPQILATNPVLLFGMDLPFVVVASTTLKNGVALSIQMFIIHIVCMVVGCVIARFLQVWQRFFVITTISTGLMLLSRELVINIIPSFEAADSMYLYLIALNGMTLFQSCFLKSNAKLSVTLKSALLNSLTFSCIMLFFSVVREYFGSGSLWAYPLPIVNKLSGVRSPFFGFILVGLLLAASRFIDRQFSVLQIVNGIRRNKPVNDQTAEEDVL